MKNWSKPVVKFERFRANDYCAGSCSQHIDPSSLPSHKYFYIDYNKNGQYDDSMHESATPPSSSHDHFITPSSQSAHGWINDVSIYSAEDNSINHSGQTYPANALVGVFDIYVQSTITWAYPSSTWDGSGEVPFTPETDSHGWVYYS